MNYAAAQTAVMNFLQAIHTGLRSALFIAFLTLEGATFLIRWGFKKVKSAIGGDLGLDMNNPYDRITYRKIKNGEYD